MQFFMVSYITCKYNENMESNFTLLIGLIIIMLLGFSRSLHDPLRERGARRRGQADSSYPGGDSSGAYDNHSHGGDGGSSDGGSGGGDGGGGGGD